MPTQLTFPIGCSSTVLYNTNIAHPDIAITIYSRFIVHSYFWLSLIILFFKVFFISLVAVVVTSDEGQSQDQESEDVLSGRECGRPQEFDMQATRSRCFISYIQ